MQLKLLAAAVVLAVPTVAAAQTVRPVTVEIVATGDVDAPASSLTLLVGFTVSGKTQADADHAKADRYAAIAQLLQREGVAAGATSDMDENELMRSGMMFSEAVTIPVIPDDKAAEGAANDQPEAHAIGGQSIRVATLAQAMRVRKDLDALGVRVAEPSAQLDDAEPFRREAKAKALANARQDAELYAHELGLRVIRVARISEAGNSVLLPGLQHQMERSMPMGPGSMRQATNVQLPGTVHVDATIIVEFVLAR